MGHCHVDGAWGLSPERFEAVPGMLHVAGAAQDRVDVEQTDALGAPT